MRYSSCASNFMNLKLNAAFGAFSNGSPREVWLEFARWLSLHGALCLLYWLARAGSVRERGKRRQLPYDLHAAAASYKIRPNPRPHRDPMPVAESENPRRRFQLH